LKRFSDLLFEAINDTMRQVFGESASKLIWGLVEKHVSLEQEEVGEKIEALSAYLEKLLGLERARIIQCASLKRLCLKLRREHEEVEKCFWVLDALYEIKFLLLTPFFKEQERSVCN